MPAKAITVKLDQLSTPVQRYVYFNRFVCEALPQALIVHVGLVNKSQATLATYSFIIDQTHLRQFAERTASYFEGLKKHMAETPPWAPQSLPSCVDAPTVLSCARTGDLAELVLLGFSLFPVLSQDIAAKEIAADRLAILRSDIATHVALVAKLIEEAVPHESPD